MFFFLFFFRIIKSKKLVRGIEYLYSSQADIKFQILILLSNVITKSEDMRLLSGYPDSWI